tara:strand:- start:51 stop:1688 length:1638 start_codon:yes stop_codon:yes gene_type:complete
MKILEPLVSDFQILFKKFNIQEEIDLKISNIENYDYQINNLVKYRNHQNIDELLSNVQNLCENIEIINTFEITNNNFINFKINLDKCNSFIENVQENLKVQNPKRIIIDYGGPNIGKPLHVGHLRSLNIGRSIYNTNKLLGHELTSDIHLGDWGMPIAQIIGYCEIENININSLNIDKLVNIYPKAAELYNNNKTFQKTAQNINKNLNNEELTEVEKWKIIKNISLEKLKDTLSLLNHDFDLWLGESDVNKLIKPMVEDLIKRKKVEYNDGAIVSCQESDPRILITKSDGSYLYLTTDLGTILNRLEKNPYDAALYVVDNRQKLHFEQLFSSIEYFDFPEKEYAHVSFGTINDEDGNPYKTREGGTKQLTALYKETFDYIKNINKDLDEEIIHDLSNTVLTYSDLLTNRKTDYKFDLNKFTNISGKTGIYIQYAQVRAKRLLEKIENNKKYKNIVITNEDERKLIISLLNLEFFISQSAKYNEPHHLANYLYDISNLFNNFYQTEKVHSINDKEIKYSKLLITEYFLKHSNLVMNCLGIKPVDKM